MNILVADLGQVLARIRQSLRPDPRRPHPVKHPEQVKDLLRQTRIFADLPEEKLAGIIEKMEQVKGLAGDTIIHEGDDGDFYYVLVSGRAEVLRQGQGRAPEVLAELEAGSAFGEEALISYRKRNATVRMTAGGILLRLSKEAFIDYIQAAMVDWVSALDAQKQVNGGAKWLDVTQATKNRRDHLPGAQSLPLDEVRELGPKLPKGRLYICYCENGRRSATAAFLLRLQGHQTAVLRGGLRSLSK